MGWRISRATLAVIFSVAFLLRLGVALAAPGHLMAYTLYLQMAQNVAHGIGYCLYPDGTYCAYFPPVYPTLLAAGLLVTRQPQAAIIGIGAAAGAGTCVLTALLGRRLFSESVGLLAATYAVVYPYFLWHDAVLQETSVLSFAVAAAAYALLQAEHRRHGFLIAGILLGVAVLTKATLLLYVPLAAAWTWRRSGRRCALWLLLGTTLAVLPWMLRTWQVTGEPALYSNTGFALWTANHRLTFDYFPWRSIDDATTAQWADLSAGDRAELDRLDDAHGLARGHWFWRNGWTYIASHPGQTLWRALVKIAVAFSPVLSPYRPGLAQWVYLASYGPLLALALLGVYRHRQRWRELMYLYLLFAAFAATCAIFWGHTSHRMYLEPFLMLFAAAGLGADRNASAIVSKSAL